MSKRMGEQTDAGEQAFGLADRVHSAAVHVLRFLRVEDTALGLTAPKLSALSVLVFRGPLTVGELAKAEQVTPATTSRLVSELEALGLVERTVDPDDGRVRRVTPTDRGVALLHEGRRRRVERLAIAVEQLSDAERSALAAAADILERLVSGSGSRPKSGGS